ncbi:MAG: SulP family inorganic anion transporter [Oxalobacter sp.]|nr:MAG: SulP family inorganic anion transporter [Oxalobacter sp.]
MSVTDNPIPPAPRLRITAHELLRDSKAGLSVAGLLLPQALAYSSIANMPPQAGIMALFAGLVCYGLFGFSRFAIVSATSSSAIVLAAAIASITAGRPEMQMTMAAGLVMITGVLFLMAGMAKMGNVTDFIAKPVLRGFTFGLAIVIIIKQFAEIVGVRMPEASLFELAIALSGKFNEWNQASIVTAAAALGLLFFLERYKWLPGGVMVVILGIIAGKWLNLSDHGVQIIGMINLELTAPSFPKITNAEWVQLGEVSLGLAFILYAESYGSIRNFAIKHGDPVLPNRDLLSLGICNLASGVLHGMPVGAGYSATAANEKHGASSRFSGGIAALVILPIVLLMMPTIALIPKPVLAAIVIHAVSHTLTIATFRPYFAWRRDHIVIVASVVAVLTLGVMEGLLVAVGISLFLLLRQMSAATVTQLGRHGRREHDFVNLQTFPKATLIPGVIILRPDQALFFANADRMMTKLREQIAATDTSVHAVVLSLEQTTNLDSVVLEGLRDLTVYTTSLGKRLVLARVKDDVYQVLQHSIVPSQPTLGISRLSVAHAVSLALAPETEDKDRDSDFSPG